MKHLENVTRLGKEYWKMHKEIGKWGEILAVGSAWEMPLRFARTGSNFLDD